MFGNKKFDEIGFKDIQELIKRKTQESYILDYKRDFSKIGDKINIAEIGKDISSFANTYGGWVIYGIQTEKDKNTEIPIPKDENAILGVDYEAGLEKKIEDMILASVSPIPLFKVKVIKILNSKKCLILIYVGQSFDTLHMVSIKKEMRFYKRYEYQAIPMDEREIELNFRLMGQTEGEKEKRIDKIRREGAKFINVNQSQNLFALFSVPKVFLKNHFNDEEKIKIFDNGKLFTPFGVGRERRPNRFCFNLNSKTAALNLYYDGIVSCVMPLIRKPESHANLEIIFADAIYSFIYRFLCIIEKFYSIFNFYSPFEIRLELNGVKDRKFGTHEHGESFFDVIGMEEIDSYIKTCNITELEDNKFNLSKEMILPLFYSFGTNSPIHCYDNDGFPSWGFNKDFWLNIF